jgi:hypothetical protein
LVFGGAQGAGILTDGEAGLSIELFHQ